MTNFIETDREWSGPASSDKALRSCARGDRVLMAMLGATLGEATVRLMLILVAACAVGAALTELVTAA